jgi:beta-phosphoglucomutase
MDGVIVDSNPMHVGVWQRYLADLGIEIPDLESKMIGRRNEELIVDLLPYPISAVEAMEHGAKKEALYRETMRPALQQHLVSGIEQFLQAAFPKLPIGLGTNAEQANMDFVLDDADLRRFFAATLNGSQTSKPKPDPEVYLRLAETLAIAPEHCVVFEDSKTGVAAARSAGMQVVGLLTNFPEFPGVDLAIKDFEDPRLFTWLARRVESGWEN